MKTEDRYLKFVLWSDDDQCYVGHCPDLFPWGGVCHGETEEAAYAQLCVLVREEIEELQMAGKEIPVPATRAMREAVLA
jgi:predicted RNase H-like HicB family nuclease